MSDSLRPIPHGTSSGYHTYGCRCRECRAANAARMQEYRLHLARLVVDGVHPTAPHGTSNGYDVYRCRCEPCIGAKRTQIRQWRARRYSERREVDGRLVHPRADHGTNNAYRGFGCRCNVCSNNEKVRQAARYQQRKAAAAAVGEEAAPDG